MIKATTRLTPTTLLLTLRPKRSKDKLEFYPGQYAAIGYKRRGRPSPMRCFSIVSSPNHPEELQFALRVQGDFTHALAELQTGSSMFVRGPFGNFVVDEAYDRNLVLLAGGIGITAFMSMIRVAAEKQSSLPVTLLYSCSSQDEMPFYHELLELERRNPRFRAAFFVTKGPSDKLTEGRVLSGRIGESHLTRLTSGRYNACTYFLCGPKGFIDGLQGVLAAKGADPGRIITEEFTPASKANAINGMRPGWSVSRWTYGLTGAAMLAATAFIMSLDLARAVPRLASSVTTQKTTATQIQQTVTTPATTTTTATTTPTTTSNSSSTSSTSIQSTSSSTTQSTPTHITSVS